MKKIIILFFLVLFSINTSFANDEKIRIISRSEWGANPNYRYVDSIYWKNILAKRKKNYIEWQKKWKKLDKKQKDLIIKKNKIKAIKKQKQNEYLSKNFLKYIKIVEYKKFENNHKLAWPIAKTQYVKNIVIHHTDSDATDSWKNIKNIYKFHSLSRAWGDIGYNYIIGNDGEIFEGRAGGDYSIGAHDTLNNRSTVGISIMGNFDNKKINKKQYKSLKKLIRYLTKKYGIDLNKKIPYHRECYYCTNKIKTNYLYPIVGHRDGKNTACPGKNIYKYTIPKLLKELQKETTGYKNISYFEIKKQKKDYKEKLEKKYNWEKIRKKFHKISPKIQKQILDFLEIEVKNNHFDWKKDILYKKIYNEFKK